MIDPERALEIVLTAKVMCYDSETSGLDNNAFVCGHVCTELHGDSVYVPVRHEAGGNIPGHEAFETALAKAFNERQRLGFLTVGHNLSFDQKMARRHGIVLSRPLEDTMINEALINDIAPGFSLEACALRHKAPLKLGDELYQELARRFGGIPNRSQMKNFWRLPGDLPVAVEYAVQDGHSTLGVWDAQQYWIDEYDLRKVWKLECALIPHLAKTRALGVKIDPVKSISIFEEADRAIQQALLPFPAGFNVNSSKEVEGYFRAAGFSEFATTATGKPSFTEDWLKLSEEGRAVIAVRQLRKSKDSFITPLVSTNNVNGRVHATLNQSKGDEYGAIGGRLSCSEPNLQAFPKRNKAVGKVVRQLVIPDEGKELAEDDFKQQEPRLYAHYSEDDKLLAGYSTIPNVDMHSIAQRYTGQDRDGAKRLGLGILACMGSKELARRLMVAEPEARKLQDAFLSEAFPSIRTFQRDAMATMRARGFVRTILGRRCTIDDMRFAYRAVSRIIQGSGGDHIKVALLDAWEYAESLEQAGGWSPLDILLSIHDSAISQFSERKYHTELVRILENAAPKIGCMVPIPVDSGIGSNWAEASYGK